MWRRGRIDRGAEIAKNLIDAGGALVASSITPNTSPARNLGFGAVDDTATPKKVITRVAEFEFDPFDHDELTRVNQGLKPYGYCIYLDAKRDVYVPHWMQGQCVQRRDRRLGGPKRYSGLSIIAPAGSAKQEAKAGILYKPLLTHSLVVMRKEDPTSSMPWGIWETRRVLMPNAAPPFLLEVKRSLFTKRKTEIRFADGLLIDVKVDKKSELNAFIDIPVRAVQVVVQIPTKALIIGINDANNQARLIQTNQDLIGTINQFEAAKKGQSDLIAGLTPEQIQQINNAGGVPGLNISNRNAVQKRLSYEACLQNAVLVDATTAESRCAPLLSN